jgi:hypothetical protein
MNSPTPNHPETSAFRVGLTGDFYKDGEPVYPDFDLEPLQREPGIALANFDEHRDEIAPEATRGIERRRRAVAERDSAQPFSKRRTTGHQSTPFPPP